MLQHVELCHPENGESPFIAQEENQEIKLAGGYEGGSPSSTDVPSENGEEEDEEEAFVDCPAQCGEVITLAELSNHIEMHATEGTSLDGTDLQVHEHRLQSMYTLTAPISVDLLATLDETTNPTSSTVAKKRRPHKKENSHHGIRDWKDIFLTSATKRSRINAAKAKSAGVHRLGVSQSTKLRSNSADSIIESRIGTTRLRRANAFRASETTRTWRKSDGR